MAEDDALLAAFKRELASAGPARSSEPQLLLERGAKNRLGTSRQKRSGQVRTERINTSRTATVDQAVAGLYRRQTGDVISLQERLWWGGFYGNLDYDEAVTGMHDENTAAAYGTAAKRAAAYRLADVDKTLDEVIDEAAAAMRAKGGPPGSGGGGSGRRAPSVSVSSGDDLAAVLDQVAPEVIGRRLSASETAQFAAAVQAQQASAQRAAQAGGGTVVEPSDPRVAAEKFARDKAPVEAEANDLGHQYDVLARIISTPGLT